MTKRPAKRARKSRDSLYANVSTEAMNRVVERIGEPRPDPLLTAAVRRAFERAESSQLAGNCPIPMSSEPPMARKSTPKPRNEPETIPISAFRDIHLHFPGDVYSLALWVAWSDRAKSTPTRQRRTTLAGLASHFARLYGLDYERPIGASDVMTVFRSHGLQGNPVLCLDDEASVNELGISTDRRGSLADPARLAAPRANSPSALAPPAESVSPETPAPPTRPAQ